MIERWIGEGNGNGKNRFFVFPEKRERARKTSDGNELSLASTKNQSDHLEDSGTNILQMPARPRCRGRGGRIKAGVYDGPLASFGYGIVVDRVEAIERSSVDLDTRSNVLFTDPKAFFSLIAFSFCFSHFEIAHRIGTLKKSFID